MQPVVNNVRKTKASANDRSTVTCSFVIRMCVAAAAVAAAYLLVTEAWPIEFAGNTLASITSGTLPSPIGNTLTIAANFN